MIATAKRFRRLTNVTTLCLAFLVASLSLAILAAPAARAADILFIADSTEGTASQIDRDGNASVIDRLGVLGHNVTAVDDDASGTTDPSTVDLVIISATSLSGSVGTHFTDTETPVIQWEQALWDEFLISAGGMVVNNSTSIEIVDITHPMAQVMGLTQLGDLPVRPDAIDFHIGNNNNLAPGATVIAEQAGGGNPAIAIVEQGDELNDMSLAAGMRIMLFIGDQSIDGVNAEGLGIFDGAVAYALGDFVEPIPGDVNGDMVVNIDDYRIIRDNFHTGVGRAQGDLDLDGDVGLSDFRIWRANAFMNGAAVPEPATCGLLAIGLGLVTFRRRR